MRRWLYIYARWNTITTTHIHIATFLAAFQHEPWVVLALSATGPSRALTVIILVNTHIATFLAAFQHVPWVVLALSLTGPSRA
jgi:hypothetical protein